MVTQQLHRLFPHEKGAVLSELRAPAGSFVVTDITPLVDEGMVEFETRTGISCQGVDDWALRLTTKGIESLRDSARRDEDLSS